MSPSHSLYVTRAIVVLVFLATATLTVLGQQTAARPDRGVMPNGSYSVSDIENISLTNGNVNLRIPLASLPQLAGGKLSWTINAHYNSKIWNVNRVQLLGERYDLELPQVPYVVDTPELSEQGGWRISGQYEIDIRDARSDFDYQLPPVADEPDYTLMNNYNWYRVVLRMPDGAEHELRPMDYSPFAGGKSFLYGYYKETPYTHGTMRYYSFDGSYLYAVITSDNNWTVYLPDGTKVVQTTDGIQRIQDTNGNKIKIWTDSNGTHYQDEQTGREIRYLYDAAGNGGQGQGRVYYRIVDGNEAYIAINFGQTHVEGQVYKVNDWIPGQVPSQPCNRHSEINTEIPVIREIVLPQTELGVTRKLTFGYSSDTTETASTLNVRFSCSDSPQTYVRTASKGWGFLNHIEMPSGAEIDYTYGLDLGHAALITDDLADVKITQKKLDHDGVVDGDVWTYSFIENVTTVTNPDSSTITEHKYDRLGGMGAAFGKSGLTYRTTRPFMKTERHWTHMVFDSASANSPNGNVDFNSVVDFEYTTLTDAAGNNLKMSAKAFQYDFNGNVTQTTEYDWFDPALVSHDAQGVPAGVPAGATVLRVTNNTYYNPASTASSTNVYAKRPLTSGTPLIMNALQQTTTGTVAAPLSITQFSYDGNSYGVTPTVGSLTATSVWDDVDNEWITASSTYGLYGNLATTTDGRGKITTFSYLNPALGLPTSVAVDPQNGTGAQTTTTGFDYYTGLVTGTTDSNGNTSTIDYTNQLLGAIDPLGRPGVAIGPLVNGGGSNQRHRTRTFYADSSRTVTTLSDLNAEGDGLLKTQVILDMLGRTIESRQYETATAFIAVRKTYDIPNRISKTSNPFRAGETVLWTTTVNDTLGRVVSVTTPDNAVVTTSYSGNTVTVTDQAGKQRKSVSDALGRLIQVYEAPNDAGYNHLTSYSYDALDNLTTVNQGSQTRIFGYDSLKRLSSATNPESGTVSYQYDNNGNLVVKTDARGVSAHYEYDGLNRVTRRWYNGSGSLTNVTHNLPALPSGVGASDEVKYFYDTQSLPGGAPSPFDRGHSTGRLVAMTYAGGSAGTYLGFDALGKPLRNIQQIGGINYQTSAEYNLAGAVTSMSYPSGRTVTNSYDNAGRLQSFTGYLGDGTQRAYANDFEYTAWNGLQQEKFGTTTPVYHKQRFNSRGQLWDMRASTVSFGTDPANGDRGAIVNYYSNNYTQGGSGTDNNGNLLRQENHIPGSSFFQDNFEYDPLNRLKFIAEKLNGTGTDSFKQAYVYDRWGNRTIDQETTTPNVPKPNFGVHPNTNRLTAPAGYAMGYDQAGNLTNDSFTGEGVRTYDAENRMKQAWANNQWQTYAYDGDGHRIKRIVNGTETWQVYGIGGELLAEYAANASHLSPHKEYGYRNGELLITAEASAGVGARTNVALASNGATATASSSYTGTAASGTINGDRKGLNYGANGTWGSASSGFPQWLQVDFNGSKTIGEIDVFTVQDNWQNPIEPSESTTFSLWGLTGCDVQYWNGSGWVTVTGGSVTGNNNVWRKFTFTAVTTSKIRVLTNASPSGWSELTEVEAWGTAAAPPPRTNVAAAANGGVASASSNYSSPYTADKANNGDRRYAPEWNDAAPANTFPDWLQVEFSGIKTIDEIDVFMVQDNYASPSEPTETMTFTNYGLTAFDVQYWNGTAWTTVLNGNVAGNNKVWRKFTFPPITTTKIRVVSTASPDGWSRLIEVEAWTPEPPASTGGIRWLVTDQLGTPRMVFDQGGSLANVSRHDYLPFGEELFGGPPSQPGVGGRTTTMGYTAGDNVRQKFTQYERDTETGLDYAEARYHSSLQGRFTSPDEPFNDQEEDDPQSWNLYSYVRNNPLRYVDPSGEGHWEVGDEGQEYYVGDTVGEYDKDLNATWDGSKWNFHEQNGQDNTVNAPPEEVQTTTVAAAGVLTFTLSPPPIKLAMVATGLAAGTGAVIGYLNRPTIHLPVVPWTTGTTVAPQGVQIVGPLPPPAPIRNNSKHNKKVADRLIARAQRELNRLLSDPPGPRGPRNHHKGEIKAMLERAKRVVERLVGKSKESRLRKIDEINKTVNRN